MVGTAMRADASIGTYKWGENIGKFAVYRWDKVRWDEGIPPYRYFGG